MDTAKTKELFGLVQFPFAFCCDQGAMGKTYPISIAGIQGFLETPELIGWPEENGKEPSLGAPQNAKGQQLPGKNRDWGYPTMFSKKKCSSIVSRGFLYFVVSPESFDASAKAILDTRWMKLFADYYEILENRGFASGRAHENPMACVTLFSVIEDKIQYPSGPRIYSGDLVLSDRNRGVSAATLQTICDLASSGKAPVLEYRLLIEAYHAIANNEFRKAIVEAAAAIEISLSRAVHAELLSKGLDDTLSKKLAKKYQMLSGKIEFVRTLNLPLPDKDYTKLLVEPRNAVIHKASSPNFSETRAFILEAVELLEIFSPTPSE